MNQDRKLIKARQKLQLLVERGETETTERILEEFPDLCDEDAILELVYAEIEARRQRDDQATADELCSRFPEFEESVRRLLDVHNALQKIETQDTQHALQNTFLLRRDTDAEPDQIHNFRINDYEFLEPIGEGGASHVYKARQLSLNRLVAIKRIRNVAFRADDHQRFHNEAMAAARLKHPNIVQIYDVLENDGLPCLALEYLPGGSLDNAILIQTYSPDAAIDLVESLANAISYANEKGIIHRDLKPANVLLTQDGTPKISDFGLAKHLWFDKEDHLTRTGDLLGTPSYMSPEQARGDNDLVSPATDVYGLGTILYEALTGRPPFRGSSTVDTLQIIQNQEPAPPGRFVENLPRDLENICLKCLSKEPHRRYENADGLARDLRALKSGKPISARQVGRAERFLKWCRRHPTIAALIMAMMLITALGTIGVLFQWRRAEHQATTAAAQRDRAQRNYQRAAEVVQRLMKQSHDLEKIPEADLIRSESLKEIARFYEDLIQEYKNDDSLRLEAATAFLRLSESQHFLGQENKSVESAKQANSILRKLHQSVPGRRDYAESLARSYWRLGVSVRPLDDVQAMPHFESAARLYKKLSSEFPTVLEYKIRWANALANHGSIALRNDDIQTAHEAARKAVDLTEKAYATSQKPYSRSELAISYELLSSVLSAQKNFSRAYEYAQKEVRLRTQLIGTSPIGDAHGYLARSLLKMGNLAVKLNDIQSAQSNFERGIELQSALADRFPARPRYQQALYGFHSSLGQLELSKGDPSRAAYHFRKALESNSVSFDRGKKDPRAMGKHLQRTLNNLMRLKLAEWQLGAKGFEPAVGRAELFRQVRQIAFPTTNAPKANGKDVAPAIPQNRRLPKQKLLLKNSNALYRLTRPKQQTDRTNEQQN